MYFKDFIKMRYTHLYHLMHCPLDMCKTAWILPKHSKWKINDSTTWERHEACMLTQEEVSHQIIVCNWILWCLYMYLFQKWSQTIGNHYFERGWKKSSVGNNDFINECCINWFWFEMQNKFNHFLTAVT